MSSPGGSVPPPAPVPPGIDPGGGGGGGGAVSSVFGRTGAVAAQAGDYAAYYLGVATTLVSTFNGRSGAVVPQAGDYAAFYLAAATTLVNTFNGRSGTVLPANGDYTVGQVTGAAPAASPAFTGVPTAPTAAPLTANTQLSTTAYADAAVLVEKTRALAAEALLAPLASPTLTGNPTAPTQAAQDGSTKLATTAYVDAGATAGLWSATQALIATPVSQTGTAWAITNASGAYFAGFNANGAGAINDTAQWVTQLSAGTWNVDLYGRSQTSAGQATFDVSMDGGATWTSLGAAWDLYAAANAPAHTQYTGVVIPKTGKALLRVRVLGKNASSTSYIAPLSAALWQRTA